MVLERRKHISLMISVPNVTHFSLLFFLSRSESSRSELRQRVRENWHANRSTPCRKAGESGDVGET